MLIIFVLSCTLSIMYSSYGIIIYCIYILFFIMYFCSVNYVHFCIGFQKVLYSIFRMRGNLSMCAIWMNMAEWKTWLDSTNTCTQWVSDSCMLYYWKQYLLLSSVRRIIGMNALFGNILVHTETLRITDVGLERRHFDILKQQKIKKLPTYIILNPFFGHKIYPQSINKNYRFILELSPVQNEISFTQFHHKINRFCF